MTINIYHQTGHNTVWNRDSFSKDNVGIGLIYSPVHKSMDKFDKVAKEIRSKSLFDPQFYLPDSQKKQFQSYDFFPSTILQRSGFNTIDYQEVAYESAKKCVDFQITHDFSKIIIPTRFFEQLEPRYVKHQDSLFVRPFIRYLNQIGCKKEIVLTVPLTEHMLNSLDYKEGILNWLTCYPEIEGIYFVCQHESRTKQITNPNFLLEYMQVIKIAAEADLDILVGYSNTESILYCLCAENISITIGAFENTRIFSLDRFVVNDDVRQAPAARIYLPKLLNWIRFEEALYIKTNYPDIWAEIYSENKYSEEAFNMTKSPAFNNPLLYKHYFIEFSKQVEELSIKNVDERFNIILSWIEAASSLYELINNSYKLEVNSSEQHLNVWKNVIRTFKG